MKKYIIIFILAFATVSFAWANESTASWDEEYQQPQQEQRTIRKNNSAAVDNYNGELPQDDEGSAPVGVLALPALAFMLTYGGYALHKTKKSL